MYSIRLGFDSAIERIQLLLDSGFSSEALVTSVFTAEKTLRRTLRQLMVSSGFISTHADAQLKQLRGLGAVGDAWRYYDPQHSKLVQVIGNPDWQLLTTGANMRNQLVHGIRVYKVAACVQHTQAMLDALARVKRGLDKRYGYSGWTPHTKRTKSRLHADPRVRISRKA